MLKMQQELYSFDVFDTLVSRVCIKPETIFHIVEYHLKNDELYKNIPDFLKNNFAVIRKEAEQYSLNQQVVLYSKLDTTLDKIYEVIKTSHSLNDEQINQIKRLELDIEKKNIRPINENIDKLKKIIKENKQVILISDIYLSSKILKDILSDVDPVFKDIKIYSSSDVGLTKRSTELYEFIKKDFPCVKKWMHFGDNEFSDVICAKWAKIKPIHYKPNKLNKFEKYLENKHPDNLQLQLISGITKYLRTKNDNIKYQFGASFAGPVLYNYVKWVISQCLLKKITDIYFVARDGFILKQISDIIINQFEPPPSKCSLFLQLSYCIKSNYK